MIDWIITHRKAILTYSLGAFAIVFSAYSLVARFRPQPEKDYLTANALFNKWANEKNTNAEILQKLEKIIHKHPELHAKYDTLIGGQLIKSKPDIAANYLLSALERIEGDSMYYPQFSRTSLHISQGDLKEALEEAHDLHEEMKNDETLFSSTDSLRWEGLLYAFNLIRIGMLEKEIGDRLKEQKAWNELFLLREKDPEAFTIVQYHFRENNLTLFDYIQHRLSL